MGFLDELEISNRVIDAAKCRRKTDYTVEYRREKLIANIEEQIELAQLCLNNQPLQLNRKRGHKVITVKPRLWWNKEPDGEVFTQIRYDKIPLNILGKGTTIKVGKLSRLSRVLTTVIKAARAGELDQSIENAARKLRR